VTYALLQQRTVVKNAETFCDDSAIIHCGQGCSLGLDVLVLRWSRDVVSKRLGLVETWEGLGLDLISDRNSNVSVSSLSLTTGSRLQANMHSFLLHCNETVLCTLQLGH